MCLFVCGNVDGGAIGGVRRGMVVWWVRREREERALPAKTKVTLICHVAVKVGRSEGAVGWGRCLAAGNDDDRRAMEQHRLLG